MLFDISNYWIFLLILAAIYVGITMFLQGNIGGKNRMKVIQAEIRDHQKWMTEAAKSKDNKALDEAIGKNWKLTMELMTIQMQMFAIILVLLFGLMAIFPHVEPGHESDIRLSVYDDGLAAHCDKLANDGIFSSCYTIPAGAPHGAWVVDAFLRTASGEQMARNATAIYVEGGQPSDIWLQSATQGGIIDSLLGKKPYFLNVSADRQNYTGGETVQVFVQPLPSMPSEANLQVSINQGTFFYYDLPITIPLINLRRIIGSYGFFLFLAFLLGTAYSLGKTIFTLKKK